MSDPVFKSMGGYVTTYRCIADKTASALEESLGLGAGALSAGYEIYCLAEKVEIDQFEWKDRTTYSDGWHFDRSIGEYVQRRDELRAHLGPRHGWKEAAVDEKLRVFMEHQCWRLNVRAGPERIVKVLPVSKGNSYPDASFRNIPQWRLTVPKQFTLAKG